MYNHNQIGARIVSMAGALVLAITFVGAAVGPARAVETSAIVSVQARA